jgi:hypothetical protein
MFFSLFDTLLKNIQDFSFFFQEVFILIYHFLCILDISPFIDIHIVTILSVLPFHFLNNAFDKQK